MFFFDKVFNQLEPESYNPDYIEEYQEIDQFQYDRNDSILTFEVIQYTKRPKITRYVQSNYQRKPIYGEISTKSKSIKKFNKFIIPEKFLEEELPTFKIDEHIKLEIYDLLIKETNLDFVPTFVDKFRKIKELNYKKNNHCNLIDEDINKLNIELNNKNNIYKIEYWKFKKYESKRTKPHSKIYLIFSYIFLFTTIFIGFIMILKYTNEKKAKFNKLNIENQNQVVKKILIEIEKIKEKIEWFKLEKESLINKYDSKIFSIQSENKQRQIIFDKDGWMDLREELKFSHPESMKGIYIIWNKTKNKYYVGQSKDINKRIFKDHFHKLSPKNYIFFRDWEDNDQFFYKYEILETKDELDRKEKEYIEKYDSFRNGYNNTGGNK